MTVSEPDSAQLLLQAQAGDEQAFVCLRTHYEPRIRRFVTCMIASEADVEDIVQDTFVALYKNLERISPPEKLRPFLFRVARNLCYDLLRRYYRHNTIALEDCEYRLASLRQSPEEQSHWTVLYDQVRAAIECLPDAQRETLVLYIEEELSQAEIAEITQTEIGTVKSRLYYARRMLRQLVAPDFLDALHSVDR